MKGMSATTGKPLDGDAHLKQSIADILSTRIGSRVCRRDYGSLLPDLIDSAMNAAGRMRLFAATALALSQWEPRIRVTKVGLEPAAEAGAFDLVLDIVHTDASPATATSRLLIPLRPTLLQSAVTA